MVVVAHLNGQNITDDNPDGFGHTCLSGLWGLHTERALQRHRKSCADGVNKVLVGFCPHCKFWATTDEALNNHIWKHYQMGMSCYHDGYTTGSVKFMKSHMKTEHDIIMKSATEKQKSKVAKKQ